MQFSCAAPCIDSSVGQKEVWVCNTDGYAGQVRREKLKKITELQLNNVTRNIYSLFSNNFMGCYTLNSRFASCLLNQNRNKPNV